MTQFEYIVKPPYPLNKEDEYSMMGVCWLIVEDITKTINFRKDLLWFEVKYLYTKEMGDIGKIIWADGAKTMGSIRAYLRGCKNMGDNIFNFTIEYDCPFKLTISSANDFNVSGLKVKTTKIKEA
jgi:hypothetical protein